MKRVGVCFFLESYKLYNFFGREVSFQSIDFEYDVNVFFYGKVIKEIEVLENK
jgi:hypothetical protein